MQSHNTVSFDVGLVMAGLGEEERAIDWLEKYRERSTEMIYLRVLATSKTSSRVRVKRRALARLSQISSNVTIIGTHRSAPAK